MYSSTLDELQKATDALHSNSNNAQENITNLTKAFELFSKQTMLLEKQYFSLQSQFRAVNLQLEETNRTLSQKVIELDIMTHYLDRLLSHMAQGILFIRIDGMITTCNAMAESILNIQSKDILSQPFWQHFADDFLGFSLKEALQKKQGAALTFVKKQQQEWEIATSFIAESSNCNQGLIVLIRDISDYRKLESLANRNDRMKELGEMAAALAHEIRNPLGGIEGFAALLHRDLSEQPHTQRMAQYIIEGTRTLNALVTNVLNYSRPCHATRTQIDLLLLVEETCMHLKADTAIPTSCEFVVTVDSIPCYATVDSRLIRLALLNLLLNAIQATSTWPNNIEISLQKEPQNIIIEVRDHGTGIAPENLEKIFSPFFTTKSQGNGFGLAEVHKIVQLHEGVVEVSSVKGLGTTFKIKLPQKGLYHIQIEAKET